MLETKCTKSAVKSLFSFLVFMTLQRKFYLVGTCQYAQLYEKNQKETKNTIVKTTETSEKRGFI